MKIISNNQINLISNLLNKTEKLMKKTRLTFQRYRLDDEMTSNSDKNRTQNQNGKQKDLWVNQQVSNNSITSFSLKFR